jgi:hypothetical protein
LKNSDNFGGSARGWSAPIFSDQNKNTCISQFELIGISCDPCSDHASSKEKLNLSSPSILIIYYEPSIESPPGCSGGNLVA